MALTPLDIQNKTFQTKMRGYNQDDVDDFLDQVVRDYEDLTTKNRELEKSLKHANEKLEYFNELKDALNQSIIVAQDTADKVKSNATHEADVIVKSAEQQAIETTNIAEGRSNQMVSNAKQKASEIITKATDDAKKLATETDDLKKKTRVFHQRLTLMLESQLQQVKSGEWDELLKPFSSYIEDSHSVIKEVLSKDEDLDNHIENEVKSEVVDTVEKISPEVTETVEVAWEELPSDTTSEEE
ncbi:MAG: DivIVA domain-containing protein [Lactobacillales bacterium]|jgi:cell division initiation protein|nr:DivIVA domain-containing protein [Lactobacillales bacterium]